MLQTGIKGAGSVEVDDTNTAASMGSGDLPVFATPAMVALIEKTAFESILPFLDPGMSTVGTRLDIAHSSATPIGMTAVCETELVEVDRRRLVFSVRVYDSAGEVGSGTHERFIVDAMKFMSKAELKLSRSYSP